jgi:hypothetical protein
MQSTREGRRRPAGAEPPIRSFGAGRCCAVDGCQVRLSRYNPDRYCALHRGWGRRPVTRASRRRG